MAFDSAAGFSGAADIAGYGDLLFVDLRAPWLRFCS
jgi:hypothetical protein